MLHPAVVPLIAGAWLLVSSLLFSDPGEDSLASLLYFIFTLGVLLSWLFIVAASIQILVASRWAIVHRVAWTVMAVVPLTGAIYLVGWVIYEDGVFLQARFDASESAFDRHVRQPEPGIGRVGLFQITLVENVEKCLFLETGGATLADGFAYCPDELPSRAMRDSPPDIRMSSLGDNRRDADWWRYHIVETSSY
jgi:hypothetical protein